MALYGESRNGMSKKEKMEEQAETTEAPVELSEAETLEATVAQLKDELAAAKDECASLKDQMLRDRADLENYRKRLIRDKEDSIRFANENLIRDLLQPLDDFARALEASESSRTMRRSMTGWLWSTPRSTPRWRRTGALERIDAVGKEFDPQCHEAYQVVVDDSLEHETVLEEYVVGYPCTVG